MGADAQAALRQGLTYLALARRGRERAADAARLVEGAGGPERLIRDVARRELTLRSLAPERRLALEMAVDEQAEVEALERQWKEAEEIADIADGLLSTTTELEEELRRRAGFMMVRLAERGVECELLEAQSAVGGGSLPEHGLPTVLLALPGPASRLAGALRRGDPPVLARVEDGRCCVDPRTVLRGEDDPLVDAIEAAVLSLP